MDKVKRNQRNRFKILESLYNCTTSNGIISINTKEFLEQNEMTENEKDEAIEFLNEKGLIEDFGESAFAIAKINSLGKEEYEKLVSSPNDPGDYLSAIINYINIDTMNNSQIQQGSINSSQENRNEKTDNEEFNEKVIPDKTNSLKPFLSISFDEKDNELNKYFMNILHSLKIEFITGERYSQQSIPDKVKKRIEDSDLLIIIFVKRNELKDGGFSTTGWLLKELGIAQGSHKEVIALVEKGIKDIAGLNMEKEIIYFTRDNLQEMQKATIKFLEALEEHKLT